MKNWFKPLAIIIIFLLGSIVYSNAFHVSFNLDDDASIVNNTGIRNIYNLHNIWDFWPSRFITYLSIALNYHFNGTDVFGYHLFNLGVHLGAAVLVWWLVLLTFSTPAMKEEKISRHANLIALFAGLIFVAHPIQTEAVTYIIQRAASMAALFYLASLCLYVKSRLVEENRGYYYIASVITAVLAMLCKEIAITLPLMILLYEFSFLRTKGGMNWKYLTPFFLTLFIIPLATVFTDPTRFQILRDDPRISSMHYFLTQLRVMVTYIRLVFLPLNQNLDYDYPVFKSIFEIPVLMSFLFLGTILFFTKYLFSKYRLLSFSICWFFLTLLPESSFFPIKDVIFEHRLYLPLVGYSMFLVSSMYYLFEKNSFKTMVTVLIGIIIGYSFLTYQRNNVWRDSITLWDDTVQKSPHKSRPYNNRGLNYLKQGDLDEKAMTDFNKAIAMDPDNKEAYINRGVIDERHGKLIEALIEYSKAIIISPKFELAYRNRALLYNKLGNFTQAIADATKAVEINPNDPAVYVIRGVMYGKQGNFVRAIPDLNKSIEIDPNNAEDHMYLGVVYAKKGDLMRAISELNKALEIRPDYKEASHNLALAYALLKKQGTALQK